MTANFTLKIISPTAVLLDGSVQRVEIPGREGDFGVLAGHAPFFSMLREGTLTVTLADGSVQRFAASSGYADVTATATTVLSDSIQAA